MSDFLIDPEQTDLFLDLAALVQTGIDGANLALEQLRQLDRVSPSEVRALFQAQARLDEAELWLGSAIEKHAIWGGS